MLWGGPATRSRRPVPGGRRAANSLGRTARHAQPPAAAPLHYRLSPGRDWFRHDYDYDDYDYDSGRVPPRRTALAAALCLLTAIGTMAKQMPQLNHHDMTKHMMQLKYDKAAEVTQLMR